LKRAVESLYEAFSNERLSEPFRYCLHCFTVADVVYLKSKSLRSLGMHDTAFILAKSISTLGSTADLNYFLPRVLEVWEYDSHYMEHVIPPKLRAARDAVWSAEESAAVKEFLEALFAAVNGIENNVSWYYDLEPLVNDLKAVVPDAAEPLEISLRDTEP
jgi:hypothetical protein